MVIEYCGGGSVEDLIQTEDLDMYQIATILSGLLKAVVYLHDHDILHRDIKPGTTCPLLVRSLFNSLLSLREHLADFWWGD